MSIMSTVFSVQRESGDTIEAVRARELGGRALYPRRSHAGRELS